MPNAVPYAAMLFFASAPVFAQAGSPAFEVASVKQAPPQAAGRMMTFMRGGPGTPDPGQMTFTSVSLSSLITRAYGVRNFQITGPAWMETEKYDVVAKVPAETTKEDSLRMLQNLLAERFHLVLHRETKEVQGYHLTVGKNGSKLKENHDAPVTGPPAQPMPGPPKTDAKGFGQLEGPGMMVMVRAGDKGMVARLTARAQEVTGLVQQLSSQLRRPVVDKTGLAGRYDFTLEYTPEGTDFGGGGAKPPAQGQGPIDTVADSGPTIFNAVQEQLGLKLEARKAPLEMLIVDSVDKTPTEN